MTALTSIKQVWDQGYYIVVEERDNCRKEDKGHDDYGISGNKREENVPLLIVPSLRE
jgi:hypothetical protein